MAEGLITGKRTRPIRHLMLAGAVLVISLSQNSSYYGSSSPGKTVLYAVTTINWIVYLAVAYFHIYYLIPRFFTRGKYTAYLLLSSATVLSVSVARLIENRLITGPTVTGIQGAIGQLPDTISNFALNMVCITGVALTALIKEWSAQKAAVADLEAIRLTTELESLSNIIDNGIILPALRLSGTKAATDPVFSSSVIMNLSSVLRYQLYDRHRQQTYLQAEIGFLHDYLELEKALRPGFNYEITASNEAGFIRVPPMAFLSVIKALLHGADTDQKLTLSFSVPDGVLVFTCNTGKGRISRNNSIAAALTKLKGCFGTAVIYDTEATDTLRIAITDAQ